jgi:hypothetical protein
MADNRPQTGSSWWQTMPGILTGLAAIITAATGLIVAFNHTSSRSEPAPAATTSPSSSSSSSPATPTSSSGAIPVATAASRSSSGAIALPPLHEVKFADGNPIVTILSVSLEPLDADRRSLTFHMRYTNTGRFDANFWDRSFRLIVDGVSRSPTNRLNELVANDSAKEGDVVFDVPVTVKDVVLQISAGEEKNRLSFTLP